METTGERAYISAQESRLGQETRKLFESRVKKKKRKRRARIMCKNIGFGESILKSRINIRIPQISLSLLSNTNLVVSGEKPCKFRKFPIPLSFYRSRFYHRNKDTVIMR